MIVQLRGTSGSGKSTLVRQLIDSFGSNFKPVCRIGRKQPIALMLQREEKPNIIVLGHYNTACGGCDTISHKMRDTVYKMVRDWHSKGCDVVYEGLLITEEVKRAIAVHKDGLPFRVLHIDLPPDECVESVNQRRRARNPDAKDVNPRNTLIKHRGTMTAMKKLRDAGVECFSGSREECRDELMKLLELECEHV